MDTFTMVKLDDTYWVGDDVTEALQRSGLKAPATRYAMSSTFAKASKYFVAGTQLTPWVNVEVHI